jgi:hypothetical protein
LSSGSLSLCRMRGGKVEGGGACGGGIAPLQLQRFDCGAQLLLHEFLNVVASKVVGFIKYDREIEY